MMKTCFMCLKFVLAIFNLVILISGFALLGFIVWLFVDVAIMSKLLLPTTYIIYVILGLSILMIIVGTLGCCGALYESRWMLAIFFVLVMILLGSELAVCVLSYMNFKSLEKEFREGLKNSLKDYNSNEVTRVSIDFIQKKFMCCGSSGPQDWNFDDDPYIELTTEKMLSSENSRRIFSSLESRAPTSCCVSEVVCNYKVNRSKLSVPIFYQQGCSNKIFDWIKKNKKPIIFSVLGIFTLEIFSLIFAIVLCVTFSKIEEYYD